MVTPFLRDSIPQITYINGEYHLEYWIDNVVGYCTYIRLRRGKYDHEDPLIMTGCKMGDILDYINKKSPFKEGDELEVDQYIRKDSLDRVLGYIHNMGGRYL